MGRRRAEAGGVVPPDERIRICDVLPVNRTMKKYKICVTIILNFLLVIFWILGYIFAIQNPSPGGRSAASLRCWRRKGYSASQSQVLPGLRPAYCHLTLLPLLALTSRLHFSKVLSCKEICIVFLHRSNYTQLSLKSAIVVVEYVSLYHRY